MQLPDDQRQLHDDLCAKLDHLHDQAALIRFMGGVLGSLLRRKGDAEFLRAVQDAFTDGLAGRPWPQQQELAREVIGMVIAKRPEVALAWQRVSGEEPHPLARRAVDVAAEDDLPEISLEPESHPQEPFPAFQAAVVRDLAGALARRLALFAPPPQRFPSPTYVHEQPFFLMAEGFVDVARHFLADVLLPLWSDQLRDLHGRMADLDADAAVAAARAELWDMVAERLGHLAGLSDTARQKLTAARAGLSSGGSDYRLVEVPVSRKRTLSVLGVTFSLGSSTEMAVRKVPVPAKGPERPSPDEMLALDLQTRLHDMAAAQGLDLPESTDLALMRDLLTFDAERLSHDLPGLLALVREADADAEAVLDGITAAAAGHPPIIADALAVTLFAHGMDGAFGFEELVRLAARWPADDHPFLAAEIVRRPRDLAFQVRDALRRRLDRNNTGLAVVMLFEAWKVLAATAHRPALDAAVTVFSAFPIAFAGDPAETVFSDIGATLAKGLTAPTLDAAGVIEHVMRLYGSVVPATGQRL